MSESSFLATGFRQVGQRTPKTVEHGGKHPEPNLNQCQISYNKLASTNKDEYDILTKSKWPPYIPDKGSVWALGLIP